MLKDALETAIKSGNAWAVRSTLVLAIGILGEYVLLPFLEKRPWCKLAKIFFAVLVVAGIVGEYEFSSRIVQHADALQRFSDKEPADAVAKTGNAIRRASDADERSAQLRKENLVLQADVLKLRERMADRHLKPEDQRSIRASLERFPNLVVNVFSYADDDEIKGLTREIVAALPDIDSSWVVSQAAGRDPDRSVVASLSPMLCRP